MIQRFMSSLLALVVALAAAGCGTQTALVGSGTEPQATQTTGMTSPTSTAGTATTPTQVVGENSGQPAAGAASHGGPVRDYVSLIDNLRATGATVNPVGEISQPFFSVKGYSLTVSGGDVQVFEYADASTADGEASKVSPDGFSVGTSMVSWISPPHFYKVGKVIALYVGDDPSVKAALEATMGPQFAGR